MGSSSARYSFINTLKKDQVSFLDLTTKVIFLKKVTDFSPNKIKHLLEYRIIKSMYSSYKDEITLRND